MKITYRNGYDADVEYELISAVVSADKDFPYLKLEVVNGPTWPLFAVYIFNEGGKIIFQRPENF